ncbi:uncharacterized protein B4U80_10912 [Leptotrombidium deliense]|uniref:Uncharacterized protein n=1 Tax=Leptotrombidium deliense TaxID=299467 RepID=A0A443SWV5_9ACAR|nr:uncharacterized protein B4U80_10912 [Leptotrombidium deliense]
MIQTRKDSIKKRSKKETESREKLTETDPVSGVCFELSAASDETLSERSASLQETNSLTSLTRKFSEEHINRRFSMCTSKDTENSKRTVESAANVSMNSSSQKPGNVSYIKKTKAKNLNLSSSKKHKTGEKSVFEETLKVLPTNMLLVRTVNASPSLSPPVQRRSKWNKMKKVFANAGEGVKPLNVATHCDENYSNSVPVSPLSTSEASFTFDEQLHSVEDNGEDTLKPCRMIPLTTSATAPVANIVLALQRNLSEDFNRKIAEWERMRYSLGKADNSSTQKLDKKSVSKVPKKQKNERSEEKLMRSKTKDLHWFDKELQKIEREKQKLTREREKYTERAQQLEKLRDTVLKSEKSNKKEVLIRTSAGEFRFEGISNDFTKKLYEWETKRGVCPESSTIALLDSSTDLSCAISMSENDCRNDRNVLQKGNSRSESSIFDITAAGQMSHKTSSNSLPSLKQIDVNDNDSQHLQISEEISLKAKSESDIKPLKSICEQQSTKKCNETDIESHTKTIDCCNRHFSSANRKINEAVQSTKHNYYCLLEDNMYLLEQLKAKEEICRRLENELELLDDKMEEMNVTHEKEMGKRKAQLFHLFSLFISK